MSGWFDLPDGVKALEEPVGWECDECGGRMTMPDAGALRFPDLVAEALQQSAASHLASHGAWADHQGLPPTGAAG